MKHARSSPVPRLAPLYALKQAWPKLSFPMDHDFAPANDQAVVILIRENVGPGAPKERYSFTLVALPLTDQSSVRWSLFDRYFKAGWKPCLGDTKGSLTCYFKCRELDPNTVLQEAFIATGEDPRNPAHSTRITTLLRSFRFEESPEVYEELRLALVYS